MDIKTILFTVICFIIVVLLGIILAVIVKHFAYNMHAVNAMYNVNAVRIETNNDSKISGGNASGDKFVNTSHNNENTAIYIDKGTDKNYFCIFPHQLYENIDIMNKIPNLTIFLIEHPIYFGYRDVKMNFNKKKLIMHRASMKFYEEYLKTKFAVVYVPISTINERDRFNVDIFKLMNISPGDKINVYYYDPVDHLLSAQINAALNALNNVNTVDTTTKYKIKCIEIETPNFLATKKDLAAYYSTVKNEKKPFYQTAFYKWQRERLNILMDNGAPVGNQLTYDSENRVSLPADIKLPITYDFAQNTGKNALNDAKYIKEATEYIENNFAANCGTAENFWPPVTFASARDWLHKFVRERLANFGTYQDAITRADNPFLFHSGISAPLNIGLLNPAQVLHAVVAAKHKITLNNIEGFVRQILGWREFSRYTYIYIYKEMTSTNYFGAKVKMTKKFYNGTTTILPLDDVIRKAFAHGYIHHIERLMIAGSLMMMIGIAPRDVYAWFMEFSVDSYDWVMINNVYSMALYSDGGLTTSKAYAATSNYEMMRKSDYVRYLADDSVDNSVDNSTNDSDDDSTNNSTNNSADDSAVKWRKIWDALYWNFISNNLDKMRAMGRFGPIQAKYWENKSTAEKSAIKKLATQFIKSL